MDNPLSVRRATTHESSKTFRGAWGDGCAAERQAYITNPTSHNQLSGIRFQVRACFVEGEADHVVHIQVTVKPQSSREGHAVAHCVCLELIPLKDGNIVIIANYVDLLTRLYAKHFSALTITHLNQFPGWVRFLLAALLVDLLYWGQHYCNDKVPLLCATRLYVE